MPLDFDIIPAKDATNKFVKNFYFDNVGLCGQGRLSDYTR